MAEPNKITRRGLAKWVVISTLDPEFSKALFADLFFLSAWESYSFWKGEPDGNEEFEWENKKIFWQEWQEWRKPKDKKTGEKSEVEGKEDKQEWQSYVAYFGRWNAFYEEWSKKDYFDKSGFFIVGERSFSSARRCEAYRFLNQIIVATEKPKEETTRTERKFRKVKKSEIGPGVNLTNADLSARDLPEANLTGANLTGANLTRAFLREAFLEGAFLDRADLSGADLTGANLTGANLERADLTEANLTGANLTGADLSGANLTGADLWKTDLTRANLTGGNFTAAYLREANLSGADLTGADLTGVDLMGAEFVIAEIIIAKNWKDAIYDNGILGKLELAHRRKMKGKINKSMLKKKK